jgi:hypothetical protein
MPRLLPSSTFPSLKQSSHNAPSCSKLPTRSTARQVDDGARMSSPARHYIEHAANSPPALLLTPIGPTCRSLGITQGHHEEVLRRRPHTVYLLRICSLSLHPPLEPRIATRVRQGHRITDQPRYKHSDLPDTGPYYTNSPVPTRSPHLPYDTHLECNPSILLGSPPRTIPPLSLG